MSLRAIRKAQREQERQRSPSVEDSHSDEEDGDDRQEGAKSARPNIFALLGGHAEEDSEKEEEGGKNEEESSDAGEGARQPEEDPSRSTKPTTAKASKRKKRKNKRKAKDSAATASAQQDASVAKDSNLPDDIDKALSSLAISGADDTDAAKRQKHARYHQALAVDPQRLIVENEMRQLFGPAALKAEADESTENTRADRRRARDLRRLGLAGAVAGQRRLPGGVGRKGLVMQRRNLFVRGKDNWPPFTTSVALGMEVEDLGDAGTFYRFVPNKSYEDVEEQFEMCRASGDPERMLDLWQFNPYHVATLLQVAEIAKLERDFALAGDLYERALFTFGRALHPTFAEHLSQGKARLDFRLAEDDEASIAVWRGNLQFFLAAWRYIDNLSRKGTWKTAYEWTKLLLSVNYGHDSMAIRLLIDQMALRSRQAEQFIAMVDSDVFSAEWRTMPNIVISLALAQLQLGRQDDCRRTLFSAVQSFPWLFNRLFQTLGNDRIPPSVWGSEPRSEREKLLAELYVERAADLWKSPEAHSLLVEVAGILEHKLPEGPVDDAAIDLSEAVHVILLDVPRLIELLPQDMVTAAVEVLFR